MKEITLPIGPQHPSLKEPSCFIITLEGERVTKAVIGLGYNHRGLEKACENKTYIQNLYMIERVCGICSHTHSTAFCQAIEELAEVKITRRAAYIRVILAELERLHSHLLWLGVAAHEIGFDTLFMYSWRDREKVMDCLAELSGNRVNYGINTPGGVRRDINPNEADMLLAMLAGLEKQNEYYINLAQSEVTLSARLSGVGKLSREDAVRYGAVGPVARSSGIYTDIRIDEPYAAYDELAVNVITDNHCDVYGRTIVRVLEMQESINIIRAALTNMPDGPLTVRVPRKIGSGEVISRTEAPRGEDVHYVRSNGTDMPDRVRIRAASEANWHGMKHMLEGDYLADVPIVIAAIDPCYSCTDRAIVLRSEQGEHVWDWNKLRQYSVDFYRQRGIDISKIKLSPQKSIF